MKMMKSEIFSEILKGLNLNHQRKNRYKKKQKHFWRLRFFDALGSNQPLKKRWPLIPCGTGPTPASSNGGASSSKRNAKASLNTTIRSQYRLFLINSNINQSVKSIKSNQIKSNQIKSIKSPWIPWTTKKKEDSWKCFWKFFQRSYFFKPFTSFQAPL